MQDLSHQSAADLGRAIAAGRTTPLDIARAFLDAIACHPHGAEIYARTSPDLALAQAKAATLRAQAQNRHSLLDGVPLSWKDNIDIAGMACEAGSAFLTGNIPQTDAAIVQTAQVQGLVCLGKTHMTELAFSGLGLNPVTATPPCINFAGHVPGGSSSGAAASVAFGLAPAAIGTDTGGSVRLPAAWNDLVGLKTGGNRLPRQGVVPLCRRFDRIGPITKTVEDSALLFGLLAGRGPLDLPPVDLADCHFAVLTTIALDDLAPAPARAFEAACRRLAEHGARLTRLAVPEVARAMELAPLLFTPEAYAIWAHHITATPEKMYPPIRERFQSGAQVLAHDYIKALAELEELRRSYLRKTALFDAVILPTCAILPPDKKALEDDAAYFARANLQALRNTRIGNLFDTCALTLPTDEKSCAISLMTPPMQEEQALQLGFACERILR